MKKAAPEIRKTGRQQVALCTVVGSQGQGAKLAAKWRCRPRGGRETCVRSRAWRSEAAAQTDGAVSRRKMRFFRVAHIPMALCYDAREIRRKTAMRRREFFALIGGAAAALPFAARAQQKLPTIGVLGTTTAPTWSSWMAAFVQRLRELGWEDGRSLKIE